MATIKIRRSTTVGAVPSSLVTGELAINEQDGILYYRQLAGAPYAAGTAFPTAYRPSHLYPITDLTVGSIGSWLGSLVLASGSGTQTVTVPANATTAIAVGERIDFVQTGAGELSFAGASGVTVNGTPGLKARAQYSHCALIKTATNTWILIGDLKA